MSCTSSIRPISKRSICWPTAICGWGNFKTRSHWWSPHTKLIRMIRGAAVIDRIMRNGNSAAASVLMGTAQFAAGDYKTAAATLKKALDLNPNLPGAWTIYGRALLGSGATEEAKIAFRRALEADPNDFDACLHLGGGLRHDGDLEGARPYLAHALVLRPDSVQAQFQIFALDAATGHLDEARTGFEKLVKQWPDFVEAHLQLAMVYARLHQTELSARERKIVEELNEKAQGTATGSHTVTRVRADCRRRCNGEGRRSGIAHRSGRFAAGQAIWG